MLPWQKLRLTLLVGLCASVLFVLGRSLLDSTVTERQISTFEFPQAVPLPEWKPLGSRPIVPQKSPDNVANPVNNDEFIKSTKSVSSGMLYQYMQQDQPLDIEMWYVLDSGGDVKDWLKQNNSIKMDLTIRQREGIGFYTLGTYKQRAYLSSCINPKGGSTVTGEQFSQNRKIHDINVNRVLPWLLSRSSIRDNRCLFVSLSLPLKTNSADATNSIYQTLETTWFSWYQWWSSRLPPS